MPAAFFEYLELRHKAELHDLTGCVVGCSLDEIDRPRASAEPQLRIPTQRSCCIRPQTDAGAVAHFRRASLEKAAGTSRAIRSSVRRKRYERPTRPRSTTAIQVGNSVPA